VRSAPTHIDCESAHGGTVQRGGFAWGQCVSDNDMAGASLRSTLLPAEELPKHLALDIEEIVRAVRYVLGLHRLEPLVVGAKDVDQGVFGRVLLVLDRLTDLIPKMGVGDDGAMAFEDLPSDVEFLAEAKDLAVEFLDRLFQGLVQALDLCQHTRAPYRSFANAKTLLADEIGLSNRDPGRNRNTFLRFHQTLRDRRGLVLVEPTLKKLHDRSHGNLRILAHDAKCELLPLGDPERQHSQDDLGVHLIVAYDARNEDGGLKLLGELGQTSRCPCV